MQKREKIVKRQKIKTIAIKRQRAKRKISSSSKKEGNYKNNIRNKTNLD